MHVILEMRDRETKNMITYKCSFIKNRSYHFYATSNASVAPTMHYTIVQQGINLGMGFFRTVSIISRSINMSLSMSNKVSFYKSVNVIY